MTEENAKKEYTFDLNKISAGDMLDIIEIAAKDKAVFTIQDLAKLLATLRKCLVDDLTQLSGAEVPQIVQGFLSFIMGGGTGSKN